MRHFTVRNFFRRSPNHLLGRYFHEKQNLLLDIDFAQLKQTEVEPVLVAWNALPEPQRQRCEADLREIHELGDHEKGSKAILDAIRRTGFDDADESAARFADCSHLERAFIAFLDFNDYWARARRFFRADSYTHYRKRRNMPRVEVRADAASCRHFEQAVGHYFHTVDGRGRQCLVEYSRRSDLDCFFAYPEDYTERREEWEDGDLGPQSRHPAFEIVFIYDQAAGMLDLHCPGGPRPADAMQNLFAEHVLGVEELEPDQSDNRIYELEPLLVPQFSFQYPPEAGIQWMRFKHFRFLNETNGDRITLTADTARDPGALHALVKRSWAGLQLDDFVIDQVGLSARAQDPVTGDLKTRFFTITRPNLCALKYEGRDLMIRQVLVANDIEPREPEIHPGNP